MRHLCLHIRSAVFPFKVVPICQFHDDSAFDNRHHLFFTQHIVCNQRIIFLLGLQLDTMGLNGLPERLIGQRLKPGFNIIQTIKSWVVRILHLKSVSNSDSPMQIFTSNPLSASTSTLSFKRSSHGK